MNWDNGSDDGIAHLPQTPVETLTYQTAVSHAMTDGMPRIVARQNAVFLATPNGEVWQAFDAEETDWIGGGVPRNDPDVMARMFIRAGSCGRTVRIYRFGIGESRSVTARGLLEQLQRALMGDERAA